MQDAINIAIIPRLPISFFFNSVLNHIRYNSGVVVFIKVFLTDPQLSFPLAPKYSRLP